MNYILNEQNYCFIIGIYYKVDNSTKRRIGRLKINIEILFSLSLKSLFFSIERVLNLYL